MRIVIGIDEVGRGSLAGPVVVVAAMMPVNLRFPRSLGKLCDSKKLSPRKREEWFSHFNSDGRVHYAVARVYPQTVDRINIARAANLAALRAFSKLVAKRFKEAVVTRVTLDGGLYLGNIKTAVLGGFAFPPRQAPFLVRTVVRADETIHAVMVASIIAKVTRDRYMARVARRYPAYGFEVHKGYGTARHIRALRKHGLSPVHRLTFVKNYPTIKPSHHYGRRTDKAPHKR